MDLALDNILSLTARHGYILLFCLSVIEGPIVTVIGGFLAVQGALNPYLAYLIVILGDTVGELLYYTAGRLGRNWIFKGGGRFSDLMKDKLLGLKGHYEKYSGRTLVLGKLTHSMGFVALIGAGVAEMPILPFFLYNLAAGIPKSLFFMMIGYYFGSAYHMINKSLQDISLTIFIIALFAGGFFYRHSIKNSPEKALNRGSAAKCPWTRRANPKGARRGYRTPQ